MAEQNNMTNIQGSTKPGDNQCQTLPMSMTHTREQIKTALKRVYAAETKPVNVGSIKRRTGIALTFMIIGTIIITTMLGIKFLAFDLIQLIIGNILIVIVFLIGFVISTKDIRKIYRSMSRFKDPNVPAYRKVFKSSMWHSQALVYATLICVVFLGTQSLNFIILNNPQSLLDEDGKVEHSFEEGTIWLQDVVLGECYRDEITGQYYRYITIEINNSKDIKLARSVQREMDKILNTTKKEFLTANEISFSEAQAKYNNFKLDVFVDALAQAISDAILSGSIVKVKEEK